MSKHTLPHHILPVTHPHRQLHLLFPRSLHTTPASSADPNPRPVIDARSLAASPPPSTAPRFTIRRDPNARPNIRPRIPRPSISASAIDSSSKPRPRRPRKDGSDAYNQKPRRPRGRNDRTNPSSSSSANDGAADSYESEASFEAELAAYNAERTAALAPQPIPFEPQLFNPLPSSGPGIQTGVRGMKEVWAGEMGKLKWYEEHEGKRWDQLGGKGWMSLRQEVAAKELAREARALLEKKRGKDRVGEEEGGKGKEGEGDVLARLFSGEYAAERPFLSGAGGKEGIERGVSRLVGTNASYELRDEKRLVAKVTELIGGSARPRRAGVRAGGN